MKNTFLMLLIGNSYLLFQSTSKGSDVITPTKFATIETSAKSSIGKVRFSISGESIFYTVNNKEIYEWNFKKQASRLIPYKPDIIITDMTPNPDGTRLAIADDSKIYMVDIATGNSKYLYKHDGTVTCLKISKDAKVLLSAGTDKFVRSWALTDNKEICKLHCNCYIYSMATTTAGNRIIASTSTHDDNSFNETVISYKIVNINLDDNEIKTVDSNFVALYESVALDYKDENFAVMGNNAALIGSISKKMGKNILLNCPLSPNTSVFSFSSKFIVSCGSQKNVSNLLSPSGEFAIFDVYKSKWISHVPFSLSVDVNCISISPDDCYIAVSGTKSNLINIWDISTVAKEINNNTAK
jgi:WD40 repeat protein